MNLFEDCKKMKYFVGQIVYYEYNDNVEYGRIDNASDSAVYVNGRIIPYELILSIQDDPLMPTYNFKWNGWVYKPIGGLQYVNNMR